MVTGTHVMGVMGTSFFISASTDEYTSYTCCSSKLGEALVVRGTQLIGSSMDPASGSLGRGELSSTGEF